MNSIGSLVRVTLFGESHGAVVGCVLDGIPAGVRIDMEEVRRQVDLRRPFPGIGTSRVEDDRVDIRSGVVDGVTTGAPVTLVIENRDVDPAPYLELRHTPRPGHADYPAYVRFGKNRDVRGGGMFSGRLTAPIAAAGGIARVVLRGAGVEVMAYTSSIGGVSMPRPELERMSRDEISRFRRAVLESRVRCPDPDISREMEEEILRARGEGDSIGGSVTCAVFDPPAGVGEPFFDTVEGELAKWVFAIPAVRSVEFGAGTACSTMRGSQHNDPFDLRDGRVITTTNNAGGVLGGLTTGMPVVFRVCIKPTASIPRAQRSIDLREMRPVEISVKGRHDPCIVPRGVAVVEASASLCMLDLMMRAGLFRRGDGPSAEDGG